MGNAAIWSDPDNSIFSPAFRANIIDAICAVCMSAAQSQIESLPIKHW